MSNTEQTHRGKGRKRTGSRQKASATGGDRKRKARHRKASASDAPDIRSAQVELTPPKEAEPKTVLQSKLDTLIGLLGETPPAASDGIPQHETAAAPPQSSSPTPHALHKEMLWCIASLEVAMAALPSRQQGIDDNVPIDPIRFGPFSENDRQVVTKSMALLKTQPLEPTEPPIDALEAAQLLRAIGTRRWNAASSVQTDSFLPAAKSARSPLWLANRISAVADAAIHWINSLKPPF